MDSLINSLSPGQEVEISRYGDVWVTVERSGKGDRIRFVRHTNNSSVVFKEQKF